MLDSGDYRGLDYTGSPPSSFGQALSFEEYAREKLVQELHMMRAVRHRNIVKLVDCYNLPDCIALVLEKYAQNITSTLISFKNYPPKIHSI